MIARINLYAKIKIEFGVTVKPADGGAAYTPKVAVEFGNNADDLYGSTYVDYCDWVSPSTWGSNYTFGSGAQIWVNTP